VWADKTFYMDATTLDNYIKYCVLEGFFQGITIEKSFNDISFGFTHPALNYLKTKDPMNGGDPTINANISIVKPDETFPQIRYTGESDAKLNDAFLSMNGYKHITFKNKLFNGTETYDQWDSPYETEVPLAGGDNLFGPRLTPQSIPIAYTPDFFRSFTFDYDSEVKYADGGLNTYRYKVNNHIMNVNNDTKKFYQYKYDGAFNLTSTQRAPIFLTKRCFLSANQSLYDKISILDDSGNIIAQDKNDDIAVDIQPDAGVPIQANIIVQINVEVPNDELFNSSGDTLYPILSLRRALVLTDHQIDEIFGLLMLVQNNMIVFRVVLALTGVAFIAILVVFWICLMKKIKKAEKDDEIIKGNEYTHVGDKLLEEADVVKSGLIRPFGKAPDQETQVTANLSESNFKPGKFPKDSAATKDTMSYRGDSNGFRNRLSENP